MAIRYSADAEIRVGWDPRKRVYRGTVRDPYLRFAGSVPKKGAGDPRTPEAYDRAALDLALRADRDAHGRFMFERKGRSLVLRRVFQAPCPAGLKW